jgi:hypothetical protein
VVVVAVVLAARGERGAVVRVLGVVLAGRGLAAALGLVVRGRGLVTL